MKPKFSIKKMIRLAEKDLYVKFLFNDLQARNSHLPESEIWKIVFNGTVLDDSAMEILYESC